MCRVYSKGAPLLYTLHILELVKSTFGTSEKNGFLWQNLYTCLWENKI